MNEFVDLLQACVASLLLALSPVLVGFVVAWVKLQVDLAMQRLKENKPNFAEALRQAALLAVQAAEQAGAAGVIEDKKQYAFQIAQQWLDDAGWDEINLDVLEAAIEAEVLQFNSGDQSFGALKPFTQMW